MMKKILKHPYFWVFSLPISLILTVFASFTNQSVVFLIGYVFLILSVMAVFLFILNNAFIKHISDNIEKGVLLCLYSGIVGMIPELINHENAKDQSLHSLVMLPFTVFMVAAAGAGGSIIATGMTIEARRPTTFQSAVNAKEIRDKQKPKNR